MHKPYHEELGETEERKDDPELERLLEKSHEFYEGGKAITYSRVSLAPHGDFKHEFKTGHLPTKFTQLKTSKKSECVSEITL